MPYVSLLPPSYGKRRHSQDSPAFIYTGHGLDLRAADLWPLLIAIITSFVLLLCFCASTMNITTRNSIFTVHVFPIRRIPTNQRSRIRAHLAPCIVRAVALPHFLPCALMNNLQSLLHRECAGVEIRLHSRQQSHGAVEALLSEECLGISIVQAADDDIIEYLAIATPMQVIVISLSDSQTISPTDDPLSTVKNMSSQANI
ncbi:hypothetical protein EDD85DRAFT_837209 [Armillaria nabsnona]|nr:hypothetical protein EDD85DRAFT_837209 [Armillaria nabsnona]